MTTSDIRLKKDITPLVVELSRDGVKRTATDTLNALRPVAYSMDSDTSELSRRFGFIAQVCELSCFICIQSVGNRESSPGPRV